VAFSVGKMFIRRSIIPLGKTVVPLGQAQMVLRGGKMEIPRPVTGLGEMCGLVVFVCFAGVWR
jgi:hypothetical protein